MLHLVMPGLVPGIHVLLSCDSEKGVDDRAFAAPKRLRPRRRDKPGHDDGNRGADTICDALRTVRWWDAGFVPSAAAKGAAAFPDVVLARIPLN
jgi:hypothetical protein